MKDWKEQLREKARLKLLKEIAAEREEKTFRLINGNLDRPRRPSKSDDGDPADAPDKDEVQ